jgi:hypothetical protein
MLVVVVEVQVILVVLALLVREEQVAAEQAHLPVMELLVQQTPAVVAAEQEGLADLHLAQVVLG